MGAELKREVPMGKVKLETPGYISALLQPAPGRAADRRVWSIPLGGVWVPFFTATNSCGETAIAPEVLGAPLRLAKDADGTPKFGKSGRPILRVVKELSDQVRIVRDNFTAGLLAYVDTVRKGNPEAYKSQVEMARKAGEPLMEKDAADLDAYIADHSGQGDGATAPAEADKVMVPA